MPKRLSVVVGIFLYLILPASAISAEVPSSEAMTVARSLVATMKLGDQYKALLPTIMLRIKPVVTQQRAELEKRFDDLLSPDIGELYTPYYNEMLEQAATVFAERMVECGSASDVRLSQGAAKATVEPTTIKPATM